MTTRLDFSLLGTFARADVRYFGDSAVLTGMLAGELVAKVFGPEDTRLHVFEWARSLAFYGRWPKSVKPQTGTTLIDLPAIVLPAVCA